MTAVVLSNGAMEGAPARTALVDALVPVLDAGVLGQFTFEELNCMEKRSRALTDAIGLEKVANVRKRMSTQSPLNYLRSTNSIRVCTFNWNKSVAHLAADMDSLWYTVVLHSISVVFLQEFPKPQEEGAFGDFFDGQKWRTVRRDGTLFFDYRLKFFRCPGQGACHMAVIYDAATVQLEEVLLGLDGVEQKNVAHVGKFEGSRLTRFICKEMLDRHTRVSFVNVHFASGRNSKAIERSKKSLLRQLLLAFPEDIIIGDFNLAFTTIASWAKQWLQRNVVSLKIAALTTKNVLLDHAVLTTKAPVYFSETIAVSRDVFRLPGSDHIPVVFCLTFKVGACFMCSGYAEKECWRCEKNICQSTDCALFDCPGKQGYICCLDCAMTCPNETCGKLFCGHGECCWWNDMCKSCTSLGAPAF